MNEIMDKNFYIQAVTEKHKEELKSTVDVTRKE